MLCNKFNLFLLRIPKNNISPALHWDENNNNCQLSFNTLMRISLLWRDDDSNNSSNAMHITIKATKAEKCNKWQRRKNVSKNFHRNCALFYCLKAKSWCCCSSTLISRSFYAAAVIVTFICHCTLHLYYLTLICIPRRSLMHSFRKLFFLLLLLIFLYSSLSLVSSRLSLIFLALFT